MYIYLQTHTHILLKVKSILFGFVLSEGPISSDLQVS